MDCRDIREKLPAFSEKALAPEEEKLAREHLARCAGCRSTLEELARAGELVRRLEEVEPPSWMAGKIMSRVREEEERKKGFLKKLFHPLHIKVPLEAAGTVLVAVLAVYLFRAVEPEMKQVPLPVPPGPAAARKEAAQPEIKRKAQAPPLEREKTAGGHARQAPAPSAAAPPAQRNDAAGKAEPPPSQPAEEIPASREVAGMRADERAEAPQVSRKEEASRLPKLPQAPERERAAGAAPFAARAKESPKLAAASKAGARAPGLVIITLRARDQKTAGREVERILEEFGAGRMEREGGEKREILKTALPAEKGREFLERLKDLGEIRRAGALFENLEGEVPVQVEIVSAP